MTEVDFFYNFQGHQNDHFGNKWVFILLMKDERLIYL